MKRILLLSAILASTLAVPGGYFYQESSSRSSSSSYKNNELQHQTEDEAYYSKRGDLEGQTKPKVNTYNQHLEYQNPNRDQDQYGHSTQLGTGSQNTFSHLDNSDRYTAQNAHGSDGIIKTVHGVAGDRNQYKYRATYGVSGGDVTPLRGSQYDTQSDLLSISQRLQNDLSAQLSNAISRKKTYDSYGESTYVESTFRQFEQELKANLTRQLQAELQRQYGAQGSRGSHSYSIKSGNYAPQANYNTQELEDLTQQIENNLMQQLRNQYQNTQSSSSSSSSNYYSSASQSAQHQQHGQGSRAHTTMYRPYQEPFPLTPEVNPSVPLTEVVSQVQIDVDRDLNTALSQLQTEYLAENIGTYTNTPNYDVILENMKEELKRNLTRILDDTLRQKYGDQEAHHNYYYTSSRATSGSRVANYKIDDLNSLKQQVENNLVSKITNSLNQQRQNYQTMRRNYASSQTHSSQNRGYSSTYNAPDKVYTSYVVFTPSRKPETSHSQSNSYNAESSQSTYDEQRNIRPAYRPTYTQPTNDRPTGYQPSSHTTNYGSNTYQAGSQSQDTQTQEQLEYDYNPTGDHRPSGSGPTHQSPQLPNRSTNYPSGGTSYPSGSTNYPSNYGSTHPSSNTGHYPSSGSSNYQNNYQTSQSNRESSYKIGAAQHQSGIEYTSGSNRPQSDYQAELLDIRNQVQNDLSRQVNTAIEKQRQSSSSYSSSSLSSDQVLAELSEELKRNLTKNIERALNEHHGRTGVRGGYSFTVTSGGRINPGNYNRDQLTRLTNQLQEDLLRQLREGLAQESYQRGSSHSSGSNAYNSYSSSGSYNQLYSAGGSQGECCVQGDDSTTTVGQKNEEPSRGDLHAAKQNAKKIEDVNTDDDQHTQQKTEDIFNSQKYEENHPVELEVVPQEHTETSTPGLARNRPSTRPNVIKPILSPAKPKSNIQQEISTNKANKLTQGLIDSEIHATQRQHQEQRNIANTEQQTLQKFDQQTVDNFDQQTMDNFDQQTMNNFDQQTMDNFDQQNVENLDQQNVDHFDQQNVENLDQQNTDHFDQQNFENIEQEHSRISQQTINEHGQELESGSTGRIIQQTIQVPQLPSSNRIHQSSYTSQAQNSHVSHQQQNTTRRQHVDQPSYNRPSGISQTPYISQQTQDLSQQTQDLSQQTEDLSQHTEDLTQHIKDLSQHTQDMSQHTEDLSQHTEDLSQQFENLNQKIEPANTRRDFPRRYSGYNPSVAYHSTISSQENQGQSQQSENLNQHAESFNPNNRDSYGRRESHTSYQSSSAHAASSSSSSESRQVHYGSVSQLPLEKTGDLEQQHLEKQYATVVQDVSHQVSSGNGGQTLEKVSEVTDVEVVTTTKPPGFWKKLGGKITDTYHKAKDSITSIG